MGGALLDLDVPEIADVVTGREKRDSSKNVGGQTVKKQLGGSGSKKKNVSRVISKESAKQSSRSSTDIFTNISQQS